MVAHPKPNLLLEQPRLHSILLLMKWLFILNTPSLVMKLPMPEHVVLHPEVPVPLWKTQAILLVSMPHPKMPVLEPFTQPPPLASLQQMLMASLSPVCKLKFHLTK